MCVILVSFGQSPDRPLVLLANRDEYYDRPTEPAHYWPDHPDILAGRDLTGKGTWLGVNKTGRFAAVTNFRDPGQPKGERSRGDLVADFLKSDIPADQYLAVVSKNSDQYTGFNLLVGEINMQKRELFYCTNRKPGFERLENDLYGLSNHLLNTPWPKVIKGKRELSGLIERNEADREKLFEILADKSIAANEALPDTGIGYEKEKLLSSIFIETPVYGTRCSTVLTFDGDGEFFFEERVFV